MTTDNKKDSKKSITPELRKRVLDAFKEKTPEEIEKLLKELIEEGYDVPQSTALYKGVVF